jgi:lipopolysaccharide exporter
VVMQVVYIAAMSRLLAPADFGVFALCDVVLRLVSYFADFSLGSAIIQAPQLTRRIFRQTQTVTLAIGGLFTAVVAACAGLSSVVSADPRLPEIVFLMAPSFILSSFGICHSGWLRRDHRFGRVAVAESVGFGIGYLGVGLGCALAGLGVYSLVAATLTQLALRSALMIALADEPFGLARPTRETTDILRFGGTVSVIGFLEFWGTNLDVAAIGRFVGTAALGQYNRASSLVGTPATYLGRVLTNALLPSFARSSREQAGRGTELGLTLLSGLIIPTMTIAAVTAGPLVATVLGPQWDEAQILLPYVCAAVTINTMNQVPATACEGQGVLGAMLRIQAFELALVVAGLGVVVALGWPTAAYAAVWIVAETVRHAAYLVVLRRRLGTSMRVLWSYAAAAAITLPAVGLCLLAQAWVRSPALALSLCLVLALVGVVATYAVLPSAPLRRAVRELDLIPKALPRGVQPVAKKVFG